jgi:flagellar hook assembly protein FlgD
MDRFVVDNLASRSAVRFFTPSGTLVRHIQSVEIAGSSAIWDGRNDRGVKVASGVYVYVVTTEDGESFVGKVAVINP